MPVQFDSDKFWYFVFFTLSMMGIVIMMTGCSFTLLRYDSYACPPNTQKTCEQPQQK